MHVQRMLKMSRVYTLAEIISKIFVKKRRKIGNYFLRSWFDKFTIWCQLIIFLNITRPLLARLTPLHTENVD